jgi:excisionase family DNA binding protein
MLGRTIVQPEAVSVADAAKMIGIGLTKTYDLINTGDLVSLKLGRRRLVRVESIRGLLASSQVAG